MSWCCRRWPLAGWRWPSRRACGRWRNSARHAACASRSKPWAPKTKAALGERDALLGAGREALVVWGRDGTGPFSYGGGDETLQSCLKGADALALSGALDGLSDRGAGFSLTVHDVHGRVLLARGRAVGGMAAVWIEEPAVAGDRRRLQGHPGRPAGAGMAARQGPGADLGQPCLPARRGRDRPGRRQTRAGGAGQGRTRPGRHRPQRKRHP